ncbi:MAG: PTS sugar transporter subunit IIA [Candidatus Hydrogenedentes bacterium]|nr:PTS sugar transporter subunit IIA [Candidatus Hydrogenedentota bacterium]
MVLTKYVVKSCIVPHMAATNKSDALRELTRLLFDKKKMDNMGAALDQILAREITESTGIGRGLAVPHARVPGLKTLMCAIGRVPEGLDFQAVDRKPVHLIFLICYPPGEQTTYLNFIATVARLLKDPQHQQGMLSAQSAEEMFNNLETLSESFAENQELSLKKLKTDPAIQKVPDAHADLILMARLQLYQEMLATARTGKSQIMRRIETIRGLVEPRILNHYDKLMKGRAPALVAVEGDTCQGCFMRLPTKFVQQVRQDPSHIYTCTNCSRYIYVV